MSPEPKYLVLVWDQCESRWAVDWYGTNLREGESALKRTSAPVVKLVKIKTLKEINYQE